MTPEEYVGFLAKGFPDPNDSMQRLLSLHSEFMTPIALAMPAMASMIGARIDLLVGAVALQHMEAAIADPEAGKAAARMLREHLAEKASRVL